MPKSSSASPAPRSAMRVRICAAYSGLSITRLSVISSFSVPRSTGAARQHHLHVLQQVVAQQLAAGDVDAGEDRRVDVERRLPGGELLRGAAPARTMPSSMISPLSSAMRDELLRAEAPVLGMIPAHQRLEARHGAVLQPDDGLEQHLDLAALERPAAGPSPARAGRCAARAWRGGTPRSGRRPGAWRASSRSRRCAARPRRAEDRLGSGRAMPVEAVRKISRSPNITGVATHAADRHPPACDALRLALGHEQQCELVAGDAGQRILRLQQPPETAGHGEQDGIAGWAAPRIR